MAAFARIQTHGNTVPIISFYRGKIQITGIYHAIISRNQRKIELRVLFIEKH